MGILKNRVQKFRTKKGLTQEDLARSVGVTRQTIIAIEKGNYTPSVMLGLKLSKELAVQVEDIFTYEE